MSVPEGANSIEASHRTRCAILTTLGAPAAALLLLVVLHSAIPPPKVIKSGDLWERNDRWDRLELSGEFGLGRDPHFGWVGWWPVYWCEDAHDVIFVRHGLYLAEYHRLFSADIPEPEGGWPEVVRTDRQ